jgi:branched-chain amino acid transport system ATP-binding protein
MVLENGKIACVIGLNGSGKSTLLKTIAGIIKSSSGKVLLDGEDITNQPSHEILRKGLCFLPQGQTVFPLMTVLENLQMGAYSLKSRSTCEERMEEAFALFPILKKKRKDIAGNLSGGERAMLGISRALMSHPKVMLLDEPSLGLAPNLIDLVYEKLSEINKWCSLLIVEQNVRKVLTISDYVYVLKQGHKEMEGKSELLLNEEKLQSVFLSAFKHENKDKSSDFEK